MTGLPERVDAVVVGGGASGLAVAAHLACSSWGDRDVLVVDDGSRDLADRAWAYWSAAPALLDGAVSSTFDRFEVRSGDRSHLVPLGSYRYRVVTGTDLSRTVDRLVGRTPAVRRHRGHVGAVLDGPREVEVLVDGSAVRASWVFDSVGLRPARSAPADPAGSLVFSGRRLQTDDEEFDPAVPVLMDFRTTQGPDLGFVYVLPTSTRSALVEHTRFSTGGATLADSDAYLQTYLDEVLHLGPHRVTGIERGRIPLRSAAGRAGPRPLHERRRVVPIGAHAGMVKASTGYGYARMQRHAAALAGSLSRHGHPFGVAPVSRRHRFLDEVMLRAATREPERVVVAFERLFVRNPGDRVLAFLDEETSLRQELMLVASLPPGPFLRALTPSRGRRTVDTVG